MTKSNPPPIARSACPRCGGDLQLDYKGVQHQAKCIGCHRWLIVTRSQYQSWTKKGESHAQTQA